jgi:hypothetical protein
MPPVPGPDCVYLQNRVADPCLHGYCYIVAARKTQLNEFRTAQTQSR